MGNDSAQVNDWRPSGSPILQEGFELALRRIGRDLPDGLLMLYQACNGGEGSLPFQPWRFVLWDLESAAEIREHEHYRKYFDQFVFFGSNGAGEYFGLDQQGKVIFMDAIAGEDSLVVVAKTFDEFFKHVGTSSFEPLTDQV